MRTIRVALFELAAAVRTRRAIVLVALYLAASLLGMSGAITALGKMEDRLAEILQVEKVDGKSGVVSATRLVATSTVRSGTARKTIQA